MAARHNSRVTKAEVELAKVRHATYIKLIDRACALLRTGFRCGTGAWVTVKAKGTIEVLAESKVDWNSLIGHIMAGSVGGWFFPIAALILGAAWFAERKMRHKVTARYGPRMKELEQMVDPRRSSSRMLPEGKPRKEDVEDA